jgi:hypothetical protein
MTPFTKDELYDLEYAVNNTIEDLKDYCKEEDTEEQLERLEELHAKVQGILAKTVTQEGEQP